jgi:hypothetical protein
VLGEVGCSRSELPTGMGCRIFAATQCWHGERRCVLAGSVAAATLCGSRLPQYHSDVLKLLFIASMLAALRASAGSASLPACALPDPDAFSARRTLLLDPGREDVPTNAFLFRSNWDPVLAWRANVRLEAEQVGSGASLMSEGGDGFFGRMDLLPGRSYAVDLWDFDDDDSREPRLTVSFSTGDGSDEVAPESPAIVDEFVSDVMPSGPEGGECGVTVPGRDAATSIEWEFTGERGTTALLFDLAVSADDAVDFGAILHRGENRGHMAFRTGEAGVREMGFVLEDLAGNASDLLVVEADFGGCGMCTQASLAPTGVALVVLRVFRRRGRKSPGHENS